MHGWWKSRICFSLIISAKRGGRGNQQQSSEDARVRPIRKKIGNPGLHKYTRLICSVDISITSITLRLPPLQPFSSPPPFLDNVRRLPLSQTTPQTAARLSLPQNPIPIFPNRIPFLLFILLNNRLRGPLPVRADGDPPQPLHLRHQCRRVPHHPLLVGYHPRSLRHERHRPYTRRSAHTQTSSTPPRHAVRRTRRFPAKHDRLPHRRVTRQERQGPRPLREGRQQERERHLGVPHSQVWLDDRPGCELHSVQKVERAAKPWLHRPTG